jgi:hypothetical protein
MYTTEGANAYPPQPQQPQQPAPQQQGGYYAQAPAPQRTSLQDDRTQRQLDELKKANEQLAMQQQMTEMKRQNELLQMKMENQRDLHMRDIQHQQALTQQSTMIAMTAANSNRGAAPITIQGPTINNSTSTAATVSGGGGGRGKSRGSSAAVPPTIVVMPAGLPPVAFDQKTGFPLCHAHCGGILATKRGDGKKKGNCHRCRRPLTADYWSHVHKGKTFTLCNGHGQLCTNCLPFFDPKAQGGGCCTIL